MTTNHLSDLRARVRGQTLFPGDDGYDAECTGWNLTVRHQPVVIVVAADADDVSTVVRFAAEADLPIAVQSTGHGVSVPADGAVLINTRQLKALSVNPETRTARLGAGLRWAEVLPETVRHGLAPLCGSSDQVGVMGYLTGGGLPVLCRTFGFAANHIRELELVTADGEMRVVSPTTDPELFWAVRGGKSNFGVVTAATIDLLPLPRLYGGSFTYPGEDCERVLRTYLAWTKDQPEEMSSSIILLRFPDLPQVPVERRGRMLIMVRIAYTGSAEEGERLVAPLRALGPDEDSVTDMPYTDIAEIYHEPPRPTPAHIRTALLRELDEEGVAALLAAAGPGATLPFGGVELRHLGGALARPGTTPGAVGTCSAAFHLFLSNPAQPENAEQAHEAQRKVLDALRPWQTGRLLPSFMFNYAAGPEDVRRGYTDADYEQLVALKAKYDPRNLFRVNHNIPPHSV